MASIERLGTRTRNWSYFLFGAATAFSLFEEFGPSPTWTEPGHISDARALTSDLEAIGQDFRTAIAGLNDVTR